MGKCQTVTFVVMAKSLTAECRTIFFCICALYGPSYLYYFRHLIVALVCFFLSVQKRRQVITGSLIRNELIFDRALEKLHKRKIMILKELFWALGRQFACDYEYYEKWPPAKSIALFSVQPCHALVTMHSCTYLRVAKVSITKHYHSNTFNVGIFMRLLTHKNEPEFLSILHSKDFYHESLFFWFFWRVEVNWAMGMGN